jgi:hypothetical protein
MSRKFSLASILQLLDVLKTKLNRDSSHFIQKSGVLSELDTMNIHTTHVRTGSSLSRRDEVLFNPTTKRDTEQTDDI